MVVPEPEQEEAEEQGETSGAAIDDHRKREALMAKFGEAADDDEIDDNLKVSPRSLALKECRRSSAADGATDSATQHVACWHASSPE
jgi:hypothetical protein